MVTLPSMAQQAKTGHIGAGVNLLHLQNGLSCPGVQGGHMGIDLIPGFRRDQIRLQRRGQNACAQRLGQNKYIPRQGAHIAQDPVRMDKAGDAEPVFRLVVLNGVAAGNDAAGLHGLAVAAL